jgi:hypothetical protein
VTIEEAIIIKSKEILELNFDIKKVFDQFQARELKNKQPPLLKIVQRKSAEFTRELNIIKQSIENLIQTENDYQEKLSKVCEEFFNRKMGYKFKRFDESISDSIAC